MPTNAHKAHKAHKCPLLGFLPVVSIAIRPGFLPFFMPTKQLVKRPGNASEAIDKSSIKVAKSKQDLDISIGL
jgi:hypothetical protein